MLKTLPHLGHALLSLCVVLPQYVQVATSPLSLSIIFSRSRSGPQVVMPCEVCRRRPAVCTLMIHRAIKMFVLLRKTVISPVRQSFPGCTGLRHIKIIKDPAAFDLLSDETRRRMNHLLRAKEMTVSQIAGELSLTPQAIYHHIRKMKKVGLVDVAREERVGHFVETYYRSAAEIFQFSLGEGKSISANESNVREALAGLQKLGMIECLPDDRTLRRIIEKLDQIAHSKDRARRVEKIAEADEADLFVREMMMDFAEMVSQTEEQLEDQLELQRQLRDLLLECCGEKKARRRD